MELLFAWLGAIASILDITRALRAWIKPFLKKRKRK